MPLNEGVDLKHEVSQGQTFRSISCNINIRRMSLSFSHLLWELNTCPAAEADRNLSFHPCFEIPLPSILANSVPAGENCVQWVSDLQQRCCRNREWEAEAAAVECTLELPAWVKIYCKNSLFPSPTYLLFGALLRACNNTEKHVELSVCGRHGERSCLKK